MKDSFCVLRGREVFGLSFPPVGLQDGPDFGAVAAAVWRSLSLSILQVDVRTSRQEEPGKENYWGTIHTDVEDAFFF